MQFKLAVLGFVPALFFSVPVPHGTISPPDYSMDGFEGIMCDSDMECEEATGYPYDVAMSPNPPKYPRLVGHGCSGADGPIYAFEEDHFPACREIVAMDWDWQDKLERN